MIEKYKKKTIITSKSDVAESRSSGFLTKHLDTKSFISSDHFSGCLKVGGGFVGIINIA